MHLFTGSHGAVIVYVNMLIRSISKIDDVNMEYSVQMTFREEWVDGRLAYGFPGDSTPEFVLLTAGEQIWMPDSFFQNEKQAHEHLIDKPNVLIRVHKDGSILYSVRISMVLSCPMDLQLYPMDVQTCYIDLASYAYTDKDIEYRWKKSKPVQLKNGLNDSLPNFLLDKVSTTFCTSKTNTGTYSCLRTVLELKRQFSYYLLQLYIPSTMLVIVSWFSFWLDRGAIPARVSLGVTTLLTMTTQASGINANLPPVSYTKAVDVWIGSCLFFIFAALMEFAWVTYVSTRRFYKRALFPFFFVCFNVLYWTSYS
uniref:Ig-like domain-containing protein n=2 Tax=Caenorhabditis japonica TaxID=281687 RepID=A0A8R1DWG6_CAEJA